MKKILLIAFLITGMVVNAQRKSLPIEVNESFSEKYPLGKELQIKIKKDSYQINFLNEEIPIITVFDKEGNWQNSQTLIQRGNLPKAVKNTLIKKYKNLTYESAFLYEDYKGISYYKIKMKNPLSFYRLEIDRDGKLLKEEIL